MAVYQHVHVRLHLEVLKHVCAYARTHARTKHTEEGTQLTVQTKYP